MSDKVVKTYCYKNKCDMVRTGFHLENYPVCRVCKEEVTEAMWESFDAKNKIKILGADSWEEELLLTL